MALARWLVDPANPLMARVTANRYWQQYFGIGIVETAEDFGSQGRWPTHPDLLDWLATELVGSDWNVKHLQRLIVTSAAYRQSSQWRQPFREVDPDNRLISCGPRFRLDAEIVRDSALVVSGLLVEHLGGRSVRPYQPLGIWKAVGFTDSNTVQFVQDQGAALYRRSLYTFWKRTAPPPSMRAFDAPTREACTVRRSRTSTPLQALVLMNDTQFVEAARAFGGRMMKESGPRAIDRVEFAFRLATARPPNPDEVRILLNVYQSQLAEFQGDLDAARMLLSVDGSPPDPSLDAIELAAWTVVANTILNLDEFICR